MDPSSNISRKKIGRPPIGKGIQANTQLRPETAEKMDAWIASQPDQPGRAEAIRRLIETGLAAHRWSKAPPADAKNPADLTERAQAVSEFYGCLQLKLPQSTMVEVESHGP